MDDPQTSDGLDLAPIAIDADPGAAQSTAASVAPDGDPSLDGALAGETQASVAEPSFWDSAFLWKLPVIESAASGLLLATLGMYVVLSRAAFVSAAVSQLAGLGVVLAMLALGGTAVTLVGTVADADTVDSLARVAGLVFGVLGTGLFAIPSRLRRSSPDALLAIAVIAASALTLAGAGLLTREYQHVKNALYGDAVVASLREVVVVCVLAAALLVLERVARARLIFVLFDAETAGAQRMRVRRWTLALGLAISSAVALTTAGIGALPAFAFSVVPPTSALLLVNRLDTAFWVSGLLGASGAVVGYFVAFQVGLPVGPTMASVLLVPLVVAALRNALRR